MRTAGVITAAAVLAACWTPARAQPAEYSGSELCAACHEDTVRDFRRNPHYALEKGVKPDWKGKGCESCHGPGQKHAETAEADKILSFSKASGQRVNEQCLGCHAGEETHRGRLFGAHNRNTMSCVDCHTIHKAAAPRLLAAQTDALCSQCHVNVRAEFNRPFRHKLPEKAVSCVDCHNPHGGLPPREMQRFAANEPACFRCHGDKRGPFPFEHAPVKLQPCTTCHEPHGSANPRMLVRADQSRVCLECHANTFMRFGGAPPAFHDLRSARFQNCTICHSKIHGSFVSRDFLR